MQKSLFTKLTWITFILLTTSFNQFILGQTIDVKINQLLQEKFKTDAPGGTFLVAKKGEIIYNKSFGLANLELGVPMNTDQVFEIGSMTKQFTAISILMLVESGKINLDDDIIKFLPDYPTQGNKITVHHLLTHTSGIINFTKLKGLNDIARNDLTPKEVIDFFKKEPMDFLPGEKYQYCNSGYVILGHIIELVSGKSYAEFVQENIFNKLHMTDSQYASHDKVVKNRASGYHQKEEYINQNYISFSLPYASGSLMSTVADLFKWQEAIKNHMLIHSETTKKAFTNYTLNDGEKINYGYGWNIKTLAGEPSYEHGGSIFGFKSMAIYLPESDIYVVGLTNCDCNSPTKIVAEIAELVVGE